MTFSVCMIAEQVEARFSDCYRHFKEFQESPDYRPYWDKCMEAVRDRELLSHIIFCNDLLRIPSISAQSEHKPDMQRCAEFLAAALVTSLLVGGVMAW